MEFDFQNVPATKKKKTVNNCFLCHGDCVLCERKITETVFNNINGFPILEFWKLYWKI